MRTRTAIATTAVLLAALTACGKSDAEQRTDCQKALSPAASKTNRPDACDDLSKKDYDALLLDWALERSLDKMSKKDRDTLDYYDDGTINGSI